MRIGVDDRFVDDRYHGVGRLAHQTLEALTRHHPTDRFVVYQYPRRPSTRLDLASLLAHPSVEARAFPYDIYHPLEQPLLALALPRAGLDVHYVPYFPAPLLAPFRLVVTVHDLILDHEARYQTSRCVRYHYRPVMRLGPRPAARIVAVSEATARYFRGLHSVPLEKVAVVPEAADPRFRPIGDAQALAAVRERYYLPERFILAVGVRRPHKNLSALLEAFALARERIPHTLVLVGESHDQYHDDVPESVARLGLADRLHAAGHVPDEDLAALYCFAMCVAIVSLYKDFLYKGFGLPALEALACGAPLIVSDRGSLPEVSSGEAIVLNPWDVQSIAPGLKRIVSDNALRADLRQRGASVEPGSSPGLPRLRRRGGRWGRRTGQTQADELDIPRRMFPGELFGANSGSLAERSTPLRIVQQQTETLAQRVTIGNEKARSAIYDRFLDATLAPGNHRHA